MAGAYTEEEWEDISYTPDDEAEWTKYDGLSTLERH